MLNIRMLGAFQISGTNLPSLPQYDPNGGGNLINDGLQQYLYDAENRICAVQKGIMAGVGQMFGYIYDADGNRVAKGTIFKWSCDTATNGFQVASTYAPGPPGAGRDRTCLPQRRQPMGPHRSFR